MHERIIYLFRHGKSLKNFPGDGTLTKTQFELKRPIIEDEFRRAINIGENLDIHYKILDGVRELYDLDGVHSGRIRSEQTLTGILEGIKKKVEILSETIREDFDLGYILDERYVSAAKQAVKRGDYSTTIDFFLENPPDKFFLKHNIDEPTRTYSSKEMQQNMVNVVKRSIDRNQSMEIGLSIMVGHEPVLSLFTVYILRKEIDEVGGKWKELECGEIRVQKTKGHYPNVGFCFRNIEYDIGKAIYTG